MMHKITIEEETLTVLTWDCLECEHKNIISIDSYYTDSGDLIKCQLCGELFEIE